MGLLCPPLPANIAACSAPIRSCGFQEMGCFYGSTSAAALEASGLKLHAVQVQASFGLEKREKIQVTPMARSVLATCNIALAARCSTEQQTVQNPVITKSPTQARQKENLPKLDDSGPGGGRGRGDDGGGGGGGGGGGWAGGFALWAFLLLLSFIKEKEKDKPYRRDALTKSKLKKMREAHM